MDGALDRSKGQTVEEGEIEEAVTLQGKRGCDVQFHDHAHIHTRTIKP
jgi:hypothetical protein